MAKMLSGHLQREEFLWFFSFPEEEVNQRQVLKHIHTCHECCKYIYVAEKDF